MTARKLDGGEGRATLAADAQAVSGSSDGMRRPSRELTADRSQLRIRPVRPDDAERLGEMLKSCSDEDIHLRFNGAIRALPPALASNLTQIDCDRQMGLVAEEADGALLGIGQLCADPEGGRAEFALLVRSDRQHHGIGSRLLQALLDCAAERGLAEVWGETDLENGRMLELTREHGFEVLPGAEPARLRLMRRITRRGIRAGT
jgi:GNAT superfamily N-acetyltransferase